MSRPEWSGELTSVVPWGGQIGGCPDYRVTAPQNIVLPVSTAFAATILPTLSNAYEIIGRLLITSQSST
jgi:hypothetical protein